MKSLVPTPAGFVEVFTVLMNGDVVSYGKALNHHSYAPNIWRALGNKYKFIDPYADILNDSRVQQLFRAVGTGKMDREDDLLVGSTYDFVWIRKEGLRQFVSALRNFCREHTWDLSRNNIADVLNSYGTLPSKIKESNIQLGSSMLNAVNECAEIIERALKDVAGLKGIAFNMCSENAPFWYVNDEVSGRRPYNLYLDGDQKTDTYKGRAAWELLWALEDQSRLNKVIK
jgi:hypothetical protein